MKCQVPQISWHGRDPVLSIDFQPGHHDILRLASGGTDSHILIWYITYEENKSVKIECASDLYRHNKSVNVVRFSPNGEFLASGDDEGAMFIWELKDRRKVMELPNDDENTNKEDWYPVKLLRGHLEDIYDLSWSKDGNFLVSSSMDNTAIMWDMQKYTKIHMFSEFKGYVQGVSWDPLNQYIASIASDRSMRIHNINTKKSVYKVSKAPWTNSTERGTFKARLFYDDTLQSYFRRLTFTPDGELLIVPSGILEKGEKVNNTCFIFSRHALNKPVISLPTGDKYTVAVKCNPLLYKLRNKHEDKENEPAKPMINLPYRMIFAVAACESILLYDTEQLLPFAFVSNIHYTHLTDLSWSPDGLTLVVSSTDGYCSFILFKREELGEVYVPEKPKDIAKENAQTEETCKEEKMDVKEVSNLISTTDIEAKITNPSLTPKRITPIPAKSPKPVSSIKDESVTPSSKLVKNVADMKKSGKKSPKMCSIKKFFMSPKTVVSGASSSESAKLPKPCSVKKHTGPKEIPEVIELSDSPVKKCSESIGNASNIKDNTQKVAAEGIEKVESMDVDNKPAEKSSVKVEKSPISTSSKKQAKCKVRLDFADKMEIVTNIDDNASDSNSVLCETSVDEGKLVEENENDWKLELSQDDSIVPMETEPSVPEKKSDLTKTFNLSVTSPKAGSSIPATKADEQKPSESKQTPKRRVAFVTLSSKASSKN